MNSEIQAMQIVNKILADVHSDFVSKKDSKAFVDWRQKHNDKLFDYVKRALNEHTRSVVDKVVDYEIRSMKGIDDALNKNYSRGCQIMGKLIVGTVDFCLEHPEVLLEENG